MRCYPATVEQKLGFDVLRARLAAYTRSRLGEGRVANLRPSGNPEWVRAELARVSELQQAFRFDDPVPLHHVLDLRDVLRRSAPEGAFVGPEDLLAVRLVLETLRQLKAYVEDRASKYPHLVQRVVRITPFPDIERAIAAVVDEEGRLRDDASVELRRLRHQIKRVQRQLQEALLRALRDAVGQGYATEDQPTLRNGRMVIPVRAEAKRKVEGFVHDTSATGQTVYIEPVASFALNNELRELEAAERREVERILQETTARLRQHLEALRDNLKVLAAFDLLQAKARLAEALDACVPDLNEQGHIEIRQGRNPLLNVKKTVPLDLALGEHYRTLVITGPNAGGKSVAMKTVGLFALMLAYGLPLPVHPHTRFSLFDHLIVDLGDEQSIAEDLSTFSSHVATLRYMLEHADARTLVLIDEAGTGTDPAEGGALAQAVLEHLTRVGTCTIATTHHGTLKVFAHEAEGVENGSMQFDQATFGPTYLFQARVPGSSYAFEIAQRMGLPDAVLQRARALVGERQTALEDLIATFEVRNRELAQRLAEAEATRAEAERLRTQYETRMQELRDSRDALRQQALDEAEGLLREANARIERTIREIREAQAEKEATREVRAALEQFREELHARKGRLERRRKAGGRRPSQRLAEGAPSAKPVLLQVGDQVVLDGGSTPAEVLKVEGQEAVIAVGSLHSRVPLHRLTKVGGARPRQVTIRQHLASPGEGLALRARTHLDLRGQRVEDALLAVTYFLDEAVAASLDRVEILHGKGTGALRQAIHQYLDTRPDVAGHEEAPWNQGGAGVTWVHLR